MKVPTLFLGIDCGTQGTKALVVDDRGASLGRGYSKHSLIERQSGAREQEPAWWTDALRASVKEALSVLPADRRREVRAIGVSGQQHGLVVLDEDFNVIRPAKLWNDTETYRQNDELVARFGGEQAFYKRFGIIPRTGYTASKLLWLTQSEPENFDRIRHILLPHEYLNFWLTGKLGAEYGDASGTAFFDVRSRAWIGEILDSIDGGSGLLRAALPPLGAPDGIVGTLRAQVAEEFGLDPACIVSAGGGDNMMGAIGTGNVAVGAVTLSLGTSSTVYSFAETTPYDDSGNVAPFCSSSGGWLPLVCTMNATNVVTATVENLGKKVTDIEEALESTPPGADGLVFLPFLNGERTPDLPKAAGSIHGISTQNFTPSHLIRAAIEGVSFGVLDGLKLVLAGEEPTSIVVIGGGARSKQWRQLLADATGAAVRVPIEEESGCLGAAIQARVALSRQEQHEVTFSDAAHEMFRADPLLTCKPDAENRPKYDAARARYSKYLDAYIKAYRSSNTN